MIGRWLLTLALVLAPLCARADEPPQWVVVTAPAFRAAVEPLCRQRQDQGLRVTVLQTTDVLTAREIGAGDARKLRDKIHEICRQGKGARYVLLVGAVEAGRLEDAANRVVPPLPGTIGRMKGQPSDNGYGCLGDGLLAEAAVGRFPARTEDEARDMVRRTLAYENDTRPGEWRRQLTLLAGVPAFNPTVDALVERVAVARFDRLDPSWSGRAIYHSEQSRFCVPDGRLRQTARNYVQLGQAITLYLGHSGPEGLYGGQVPYLDRDDWAKLKITRGPGVFATFGCNGCQLRGEGGEGYGVAAVRNPGGPVAVLGSHGICFAGMAELAADGFCESFFAAQPPERLGACWLRLKEGLAKKALPFYFPLLDAVDGDSKIPAAVQRLEHLEMFVLLGDPALKLPTIPADVKLTCATTALPGQTFSVEGHAPARLEGARVRVTLERTPTSQPADLVPLPKEPGAAHDQVMRENHERANTFVLAPASATVQDGQFEVRLQLPAKLPWPRLTLRAYAQTERSEGMGVVVIGVQKP